MRIAKRRLKTFSPDRLLPWRAHGSRPASAHLHELPITGGVGYGHSVARVDPWVTLGTCGRLIWSKFDAQVTVDHAARQAHARRFVQAPGADRLPCARRKSVNRQRRGSESPCVETARSFHLPLLEQVGRVPQSLDRLVGYARHASPDRVRQKRTRGELTRTSSGSSQSALNTTLKPSEVASRSPRTSPLAGRS
jgi:hypothetical protein